MASTTPRRIGQKRQEAYQEGYQPGVAPADAEDYKQQGYLFAGWFIDESCTEALTKENQANTKKAYAKYVDSEILGLKAQISSNLVDDNAENDGEGSIRFVTTVDSLKYQKVGFVIQIGDVEKTVGSNKVYKVLYDIIPGSSIREVYEDSHVNYSRAEKSADEVKEKALGMLMKEKEYTYSVYSTNSFGGKEIVKVPEMAEGIFTDADGTVLEAQKCEGGYDVLVDVKPFASVQVNFVPQEAEEQKSSFVISESGMETPFFVIEWSATGQLTKIFDKESNRNVLKEGQEGNVLEIFEDKPFENDAWDVELYHFEKMQKVNVTSKPEVIENGLLKAVVRFCYEYQNSTFVQDMIVYKDSRRIDFKTHADWHERNKFLKAAFYTDIRTTKATYDIQFGHVERPTHWNNSWDWAKFEVCGHKWGDVSDAGYGVSLMNDCKYGYGIKDGVMRLSLLRSPKFPDTHADMEEHDFTYSLYPHMGNVAWGGTIEEANRLNLPAQVVSGTFCDERRIVSVDNKGVLIDVVKKAEDEDCLIVRMHECRGGRQEVTLTSDYPVQSIVPCNLLEHDCGESVEGASVSFVVKPFEIKTFKLYFS